MESNDRFPLIGECIYIFVLSICLFVTSPYLLVFGDDCVIRYARANNVACVAGET